MKTQALLWIPYSSCSLHDTKSIWYNDWHCPEMTGYQPSCRFTQENQLKMSVKKLDYIPVSLVNSLQTHGIVSSVTRLQGDKMGIAWCQKQHAQFI
jgi:hypothetical protein